MQQAGVFKKSLEGSIIDVDGDGRGKCVFCGFPYDVVHMQYIPVWL